MASDPTKAALDAMTPEQVFAALKTGLETASMDELVAALTYLAPPREGEFELSRRLLFRACAVRLARLVMSPAFVEV